MMKILLWGRVLDRRDYLPYRRRLYLLWEEGIPEDLRGMRGGGSGEGWEWGELGYSLLLN
jgi:hypothetical protein